MMRRTLLPCLAACWLLVACGTDESGLEELSTPSAGGSSAGGSSAGSSGSNAGGTSGAGGASAGKAGSGGTAGSGGSDAGSGGSDAGAGGSDAGAGGSDAGSGGSDAGSGGANAGSGGSDAGAGGSDAGAGGSGAGAGGSDAGAGGSAAGAGGSDAGSGGSDAGAGGSDAGAGGSDAGAGGSAAGAGGSVAGTGGAAGSGGSNAGAGGSGGAAGGPVSCGSGYTDSCEACLEDSCCAQAEACGANCKACLFGDETGENCDGNGQVQALLACAAQSCKAACYQGNGGTPVCDAPKPAPSGGSCVTVGSNGFTCNPVTNGGCGDPGAACDVGQNGGFFCYSDGNTEDPCEPCGQNGAYCKAGYTCVSGQCQAYCCDDGDCNGGVCDKQGFPGGDGVVGLCRQPPFGGVSLCKEDFHEPNNAADSAETLAPEDDCSFQNNISVVGAIQPSSDQDWYRVDFEDTNQCALAPTFQFQGNSGLRVCAYFKCNNGSTTAGQQVQCGQGDGPSNNAFGPGCCTTDGNLTPTLNCSGEDDSAEVLVRVDTTSNNACIPYRLRYGF